MLALIDIYCRVRMSLVFLLHHVSCVPLEKNQVTHSQRILNVHPCW